jgi:hypothetical protein
MLSDYEELDSLISTGKKNDFGSNYVRLSAIRSKRSASTFDKILLEYLDLR